MTGGHLKSRMEANYKFMLARHNFAPVCEVALSNGTLGNL